MDVRDSSQINWFFRVLETDAEIEARIAKWDEYLDDEDDEKKAKSTKSGKQHAKKSGEKPKVPKEPELSEATAEESKELETPGTMKARYDEDMSSNSDDSSEAPTNNE